MAEFDNAGGGTGTFVMGCWLEGLLLPFLRYLDGPSSALLRLEARRALLSRLRTARSAAASSSFSLRRVTC